MTGALPRPSVRFTTSIWKKMKSDAVASLYILIDPSLTRVLLNFSRKVYQRDSHRTKDKPLLMHTMEALDKFSSYQTSPSKNSTGLCMLTEKLVRLWTVDTVTTFTNHSWQYLERQGTKTFTSRSLVECLPSGDWP